MYQADLKPYIAPDFVQLSLKKIFKNIKVGL